MGGSVLALADPRVQDLSHLVPRRLFRAERGQDGQRRKIHGRNGRDLLIKVPLGTVVLDADSGGSLADLTEAGQEELLVRGGKGGKGNPHFATPTNRSPKRARQGDVGERKDIILELRIPCDVVLLGLPNSGKSTLLAGLTGASPKVASYPFTTRHPEAGVVTTSGFARLVVVELPPLVRGAFRGKGLGQAFLRHAERARLLAVVVGPGMPGPRQSYRIVLDELRASGRDLGTKPHIVILTKGDIWSPPESDAFPLAKDVFTVSVLKASGMKALLTRLGELLGA